MEPGLLNKLNLDHPYNASNDTKAWILATFVIKITYLAMKNSIIKFPVDVKHMFHISWETWQRAYRAGLLLLSCHLWDFDLVSPFIWLELSETLIHKISRILHFIYRIFEFQNQEFWMNVLMILYMFMFKKISKIEADLECSVVSFISSCSWINIIMNENYHY